MVTRFEARSAVLESPAVREEKVRIATWSWRDSSPIER